MTNEDLIKLQNAELEILDCFVEICRKYHLRYYLNAGTLLGAVRHRGFIPWDDDIDVCMPRSDYEEFLKQAEIHLPSNMRAVYFRNQKEKEHLQYSCQIVCLDYPLIQDTALIPRETYAWIDVFPLDGMPGNKVRRKLHGCYLLYRRAMMQLSMFDENANVQKTGRPAHERVMIWFCRKTAFGRRLNPRRQMEKLDYTMRKVKDSESDLWINFMGAYKLKETFPVSYYGSGKDYEFDGRTLTGPVEGDAILTALYGDYMTPRKPVNEADGHRLSFKTP